MHHGKRTNEEIAYTQEKSKADLFHVNITNDTEVLTNDKT